MDFYTEIIKEFGPDDSYVKPDWESFKNLRIALERAMIVYALKRARGNQFIATKHLGLNRNTLRKRIKLLGLENHPILKTWQEIHGGRTNSARTPSESRAVRSTVLSFK